MREEKTKSPSQKNKRKQSKELVLACYLFGYRNCICRHDLGLHCTNKDAPGKTDSAKTPDNGEVVVDVNASKESFKYPFSEELLNDVAILQDYYDMEADEAMRENALLVFNQSYVTNTGVSISIDGKPFEVVAAMSGVVEEVITDVFSGDEIVLKHADGMKTVYSSLTGILVKQGDEVAQGEPLAMTTQNEWNPAAGVHLLFEVYVDGEPVNPGKHLAF